MDTSVRRELAIDARGLVKVYGRRGSYHRALDGLTLEVPYGGVHGFLGPNGSGKTTTIRILLGLVRVDAGQYALLGRPQPQGLSAVITRVGAIVEMPRFMPSFTARQALTLLADGTGVPVRRVDEVLDQVGLLARAKDRVAGFSLGMRQRLAIATTLLKDPDLFIFDEPTNGLDPEGIQEVRRTIAGLGAAGRTVLLSSHLLAEVAQVADRVSIVNRGRLVTTSSVADLTRVRGRVLVGVEAAQAVPVLRAAGWAVEPTGSGALAVTGAPGPRDINQLLAAHGLWAESLHEETLDLESSYLSLVGGAPR